MEVSGQLHTPVAFSLRERGTDTHWIGGWVGPRAGLDEVVKDKFPAPTGTRTSIIQTVAQRCTAELSRQVSFLPLISFFYSFPLYLLLLRLLIMSLTNRS
jgi:hypothetical protein